MDVDNYQSNAEENLSQYRVESPLEIEYVLRGMMDRKVLVSGGHKGSGSFLTIVLGIDSRERAFYLECPLDNAADAAIQSEEGLPFIARYEGIEVRFTARQGKRVQYDGSAAYRLEFPSDFLRIQRREYYRIDVPRLTPSTCRIPVSEQLVIDCVMVDISVGGLGLEYASEEALVSLGQTIHGCRLQIPEVGEFLLSFKIKNQTQHVKRSGERFWQIGCEYVDLPSAIERELQRYIFKLERERRAQQ